MGVGGLRPYEKVNSRMLICVDKIDDFCFLPHLKKVISYSKLPLDERLSHLAATTLQVWLGNITQFFTFLMTRNFYIGIMYKFNQKKR